MKINLPTQLTLLRMAFIPPFLVVILFDNPDARIAAFLIFGLASLTDHYDGKLARKLGVETTLGKFLDPLADKLLISTALISFVQIPEINVPSWMVVLIIGREFLITGLRSLAASKGQILQAQFAGKFKTTSQIVSILAILIILSVNSYLETYFSIPKGGLIGMPGWHYVGVFFKHGPYWLIAWTTILTIVSGAIYIKMYKNLFSDDSRK